MGLAPKSLGKKGFMFTLDALLASIILVGGLVLISQHLLQENPKESFEFVTTDLLSALTEMNMSDIAARDPVFWVYLSTSSNCNNTNINYSVLEQIGTYWAASHTPYDAQYECAMNLSNYVLGNLSSSTNNMGFSLFIENESNTLFEKTWDYANNTISSSRMITGVQQGEALTGSTSSAYLRRIRDKSTYSFAYFGGFVGQGEITVRLDNLPSDILSAGNVKEIFLEGEFDSNFELLINENKCLSAAVNGANVERFNATNCSSQLKVGNNTVTLNFTQGITNASISGGLLGIKYVTNEIGSAESSGQQRNYLPGINGVINLYDGFMIPGRLIGMNISLHYWIASNVTLPIFFDIGNITVLNLNITGDQTHELTNSYLSSLLNNFSDMINTTIPIRMGFYEGNMSNSTGNITDVFVLTSRHNSMSKNDIVNTSGNVTRMDQAKHVDNLFVDIVLNASGNRVGLVSFGTGASVDLDSGLTTDASALHTAINGYSPHPADAQRYLCGAMETAKSQLIITSNSSRKRAVILMTDGDLKKTTGNTATCAYGQTDDTSIIWKDVVHQACNFSDPSHGNPYNITFYTIAFGPEAVNNAHIINNLSLIANCTGGKFGMGNNASVLNDIYTQFANELAQSSVVYTFQRATSAKDVASNLYNDSFIDIVYEPETPGAEQNQIPLTFQTPQFGSCTPTVTIPEDVVVIDARVVSYSGDFWTKRISVDGNIIYNIGIYGDDYVSLGDPFQVFVPPGLLTSGDHVLNIVLGANSSTDVACSMNDSLIYTAFINSATNRTIVLPTTKGCIWTVESEEDENQTLEIPTSYSGTNTCNYTNASIGYNNQDAYDFAVYSLLKQLDPDNDGRVSINFQEEDLEIQITTVENVPYLWGPTLIKAKVWQ